MEFISVHQSVRMNTPMDTSCLQRDRTRVQGQVGETALLLILISEVSQLRA